MSPTEFDQYTEELQHALQSFDEVFGLVTLGSTADARFRDQWSDHDFWMITKSGSQANFLDDLSWLPHSDHVLLKVRHSNGYTVVYDDKHKVEFAVFDSDEARKGKAERYSVLIDREGIVELMQSIHVSTVKQSRTQAEALENLCVIVWSACERYERGEQLSARQYLDGFATNQLLSLVAPPSSLNRDQLDPRRRLEMSSPDLALEVLALRDLPIPKSALRVLEIAERELQPKDPSLAWEKVMLVRDWIQGISDLH